MRAWPFLLVLVASPAVAETPGELLKQGVEQYKAGKYADAVVSIGKAYELDPKPETLFTLAQAERLAGDCKSAAAHYKQVIEKIHDLAVAKLVRQNLELCERVAQEPEVKPEPKPAAKPQIITRTVVRDTSRTDKLGTGLYIGGALALGLSGGLYFAARGNRDAADRAGSLRDHDELADRANTQFTMMWISAGAGAAMVGGAILRSMTRSSKAEVAIAPSSGGGVMVLSGRW